MELIVNYFNRLTLLFLQEIVQKRIERMQRKVEGMHNLSVMLEVLITILIIIILIMVEGMHNLSVMLDVLLHIKKPWQVFSGFFLGPQGPLRTPLSVVCCRSATKNPSSSVPSVSPPTPYKPLNLSKGPSPKPNLVWLVV